MSNFLCNSSIGKKLVMSISGCFLVLFLLFHMSMNIAALFSAEAYNAICAFLGANWYAVAATGVLAAGVFVHFAYALMLTIQNRKARGQQRYAVTVTEKGVSWASKNMLVLGVIVILGLLLHLKDFLAQMQLVEILGHHTNSYGLAPTDGAGATLAVFGNPVFSALYIVWLVALWFHLTHGVWSMLHTMGFNSKVWMKRVKCIANIVATLIIAGFMLVVVACFIKTL